MTTRAHCMTTPFDATTGAALTAATVNVFQPGTVTPVSGVLFDKNGNALSNPLTSDATTGLIDFYMTVAQEVDLQVAKSGYTTRTYSNVPVLDDASFDLSALLTTTGDIPYASANNVPARLAISATAGAVMAVSAGLPSWSTMIQIGASGIGLNVAAAGARFNGQSVVTGPSTVTNNQYHVEGGITNAATPGVSVPSLGAWSAGTISFAKAFTNTPNVTAVAVTNGVAISGMGASTTGFTCQLNNVTSGSFGSGTVVLIQWIAFGN